MAVSPLAVPAASSSSRTSTSARLGGSTQPSAAPAATSSARIRCAWAWKYSSRASGAASTIRGSTTGGSATGEGRQDVHGRAGRQRRGSIAPGHAVDEEAAPGQDAGQPLVLGGKAG